MCIYNWEKKKKKSKQLRQILWIALPLREKTMFKSGFHFLTSQTVCVCVCVSVCVCVRARAHVHAHLVMFSSLDGSSPGSFVHGIFQARILECDAISSSRGSSQPRDQIHISFIPCTGRWILYLPEKPTSQII